MKKILVILSALLIGQAALFAQKNVSQSNVPERYVNSFESLTKGAKVTPTWTMMDSVVYDAAYTNENGNKMSYRFSPRGTETRWFVEAKYYPQAIKDTVANHYPKFKITELYALSVRNKVTYQARIAKKGGFLFFKKETSVKLLNFETDGKFIDEIAVK